MGNVAAPEWLEQGSDITDGAAALAVNGGLPDKAADVGASLPDTGFSGVRGEPSGAAAAASVSTAAGCAVLVAMSATLMDECAGAFDPMVLAQLDAALAHELAARARDRAGDAAGRLEQQLRAGAAAENLADLAGYVASARLTATKAEAQAAAATEVALSLGGTLGSGIDGTVSGGTDPAGFDRAVVDRVDGSALVDVIARLEMLKNAAAAVQAHAEAVFTAQQRLSQARAAMPHENLGRGVAQQLGLARHESPHRGCQLCELAQVLVREMPHTMHAFTTGHLSEYRASILVRETACLSIEDRAAIDALICSDPEKAALLGNRQLAVAARSAACSLDAAAMAKRYAKAESERHVSLRPAADGMTLLTALIPLKQGVRILNMLTRVADTAKAGGDCRGKGQIMADALMHRIIQHAPCDEGAGGTGAHGGTPPRESAGTPESGAGPFEAGSPSAWTPGTRLAGLCTTVSEPDITLELVMTDRALFDGANDPAILVGHEPIPAPTARALVYGIPAGGDADGAMPNFSPRVWLKRLFTHPEGNSLVAMESKGPLFPEGMKEFLRLRDQTCATPYCGAPHPRVRPHQILGGGRSNHHRQRAGTVCRLQPGQGSSRLDYQAPGRRHNRAPDHRHNTHRAQLRLGSPFPPRPQTHANKTRQAVIESGQPLRPPKYAAARPPAIHAGICSRRPPPWQKTPAGPRAPVPRPPVFRAAAAAPAAEP